MNILITAVLFGVLVGIVFVAMNHNVTYNKTCDCCGVHHRWVLFQGRCSWCWWYLKIKNCAALVEIESNDPLPDKAALIANPKRTGVVIMMTKGAVHGLLVHRNKKLNEQERELLLRQDQYFMRSDNLKLMLREIATDEHWEQINNSIEEHRKMARSVPSGVYLHTLLYLGAQLVKKP